VLTQSRQAKLSQIPDALTYGDRSHIDSKTFTARPTDLFQLRETQKILTPTLLSFLEDGLDNFFADFFFFSSSVSESESSS
jgi:hypothetical protein